MDLDCSEAVDGDVTALREAVISDLAARDEIVYKSQQRGEPDLTVQERRELVRQCLTRCQPHNFLSRFNTYMEPRHFEYFKRLYPQCDYEVSFYLRENSIKKKETMVKNRRLEALRRLAAEGEYFSEEEMRRRSPLLYQHLVGRYLTRDQTTRNYFSHVRSISGDGCKLSTLLLEQEERVRADNLMREQEKDEEDMEACSDEGSERDYDDSSSPGGEGAEQGGGDLLLRLWGESCSSLNCIEVPGRITEAEKRLMLEEFRSHMYRQFLGGEDPDFDYNSVDNNVDYDDLDSMGRDAQDKYFDSESPEDVGAEASYDTMSSRRACDIETMTGGHFSVDGECDSQNVDSRHCGRPTHPSHYDPDDDPLDAFMSQLHRHQNHQEISAKMKNTFI